MLKKALIIGGFAMIALAVFIIVCCNTSDKKSNVPLESSDQFLEGYITEEEKIIYTEHFKIEIPSKVYVPGYFEEYLEVIYDALEETSGLKFYNNNYNPDRIVIEVEKNNKKDGSEFGESYSYTMGSIMHISSGSLLLGNDDTLIHELSHILQYSQSSWVYNEVLTEGFAQYNAYKTIKYLEENNIEVAKSNIISEAIIGNVVMNENVYSKSLEYWMENVEDTYQVSDNGAYSIGMRFMCYLEDEYGDYTNWISHYEQIKPSYTVMFSMRNLNIDKQLESLKDVYGKNVLNKFYDWLEINEKIYFENPWEREVCYDLTKLKKSYVYPYFFEDKNITSLSRLYKFSYNNLYVNISEVRNYLQNYKGKNINKLKLKLSDSRTVEFYDSNNNLIVSKYGDSFSLKNVSYIKLVGKGTLGSDGNHGLKITY